MVSNQQTQQREQPNKGVQNQWLIGRLLKEKTIVVFLVLCVFVLSGVHCSAFAVALEV